MNHLAPTSRMHDEICQQPEALERTLHGELNAVAVLRDRFLRNRPRLIVLAARGTSDNAAQFGRYLLEVTTGIPVSLAAPSVFTLYEASLDLKDTLLVAISQSGESTDTNLVLERAGAQGAFTVGITNEEGSALARLAQQPLIVRAGTETSVAATKTYTGQLLVLYLLAYALGAQIQISDLERIPEWASNALALDAKVAELSGHYSLMDQAVVVGRGFNYSNAFELALKLMETCYVVAERFSSADFLHGPIAMVHRAFPVFLFAPPGLTWPGTRELIEKLAELRANTLVISDAANSEALTMTRRSIAVPVEGVARPGLPMDIYTPIPYIIPAQLFAAHLAGEKGINPDQPRTLTKVTQTL